MSATPPAFAITGASSGIGRALAIALAQRGANLILGARNQTNLEETKQACDAAGGKAIALPLDVTQPESCKAFIERGIEAFGSLDCLVNNAGTSLIANFEDITDLKAFETVMRVNYLGTVYCTHFALPYLKKSNGLLVGISSLCGKIGVPTRSGYVASKHAMQGFLDTLRMELVGSGVDVLVVSPGYVATDIRSRAMDGLGGVLGKSNRDEGQGTMSVEACTQAILRGIDGRKREVVMTAKGKLIGWGKAIAPGILDRVTMRSVYGKSQLINKKNSRNE